jgi:hypothetical protein
LNDGRIDAASTVGLCRLLGDQGEQRLTQQPLRASYKLLHAAQYHAP